MAHNRSLSGVLHFRILHYSLAVLTGTSLQYGHLFEAIGCSVVAHKFLVMLMNFRQLKNTWANYTGRIEYTHFKPNQYVNVTWDMVYPHKGGVKIELLDATDHVIQVLQDYRSNNYVDDLLTPYAMVRMPLFDCVGCTLRLTQLTESWGPKYNFRSCADIDIFQGNNNTCNFAGIYDKSICMCNRLYQGINCQLEDECWSDADCRGRGRCLTVSKYRFPKMVCFCQMGYFGRSCEKESTVKDMPQARVGEYVEKRLNDNDRILWKILPATREIEMIYQFRGTSWGGVGWRPQGISQSCTTSRHISSDNSANRGSPAESSGSDHYGYNNHQITGYYTNSGYNNRRPYTRMKELPERTSETEFHCIEQMEQMFSEACSTKCNATTNCTFNLAVSFSSLGDRIIFDVEAFIGVNEWVAFGLSNLSESAIADLLWISVEGDRSVTVTDRVFTDKLLPVVDTQQNIHVISTSFNDKKLKAKFSRDLISKDSDQDFSPKFHADNCTETCYIIYPLRGSAESATLHLRESLRLAHLEKFQLCTFPLHDVAQASNGERVPLVTAKSVGASPSTPQGPKEHVPDLGEFYYDTGDYIIPIEPIVQKDASYSHELHPMDCADVVLGMARGYFGRVQDAFSLERAGVLADVDLGGHESLTAALATEVDGVTTILFRKALQASEEIDHSFRDEFMTVIWATGTDKSSPVFTQGQQFSHIDGRSLDAFFEADVPKYHGPGQQRGVTEINFFENSGGSVSGFGGIDDGSYGYGGRPVVTARSSTALPYKSTPWTHHSTTPDWFSRFTTRSSYRPPEYHTSGGSGYSTYTATFTGGTDQCKGGFRYPSACEKSDNCLYDITYEMLTRRLIRVHLRARVGMFEWTGVGFNPLPFMRGAQIVTALVNSYEDVLIENRKSYDTSTEPISDNSMPVFNVIVNCTNGILHLQFEKVLDFQTDACFYFLFPVIPGILSGNHMRKHSLTPIVSKQPLCPFQCINQNLVTQGPYGIGSGNGGFPVVTDTYPINTSPGKGGSTICSKLVQNRTCADHTKPVEYVIRWHRLWDCNACDVYVYNVCPDQPDLSHRMPKNEAECYAKCFEVHKRFVGQADMNSIDDRKYSKFDRRFGFT